MNFAIYFIFIQIVNGENYGRETIKVHNGEPLKLEFENFGNYTGLVRK